MNFFVIGLPRSRTAWLANFLTNERLCFHEGLNNCNSIAEYKLKLGKNNGDSSTGLMLLDMNNLFPNAPKVIIESDIQRASDYAYKTYKFFDPEYFKYLQLQLNEIEGLRISFDEIDDRLEEIWNYLIGTTFNHQRAEILKRMNVEIKDPFDFNQVSMRNLMKSEIQCNITH